MPECQVNSHRYLISLCWRSPRAESDRLVHCVGPRSILLGYACAKLIKAGAELVGATMTTRKVELTVFEGITQPHVF